MHGELRVDQIEGHRVWHLLSRRRKSLKSIPHREDGFNAMKRRGRRRQRRRFRGWDRLGEPGAIQDELAQLRNRDPLDRVAFKDTAQDVNHLGRQGQNGLEEEGILEVGPIRGVLERSALPGITTTGQVHQHDAQTPDVVGR